METLLNISCVCNACLCVVGACLSIHLLKTNKKLEKVTKIFKDLSFFDKADYLLKKKE